MSLIALESFASRLQAVVLGSLPAEQAAPSQLEACNLLDEIRALLDSETAVQVQTNPSVETVACDLAWRMLNQFPGEDYGLIAARARKMAEILCRGR